MENPLLDTGALPVFSSIRPDHIKPAVSRTLEEGRRRVRTILEDNHHSWETIAVPIEAMHHTLSRVWSPVEHLNAVLNSEALREAYNDCLPLLTAYNTELAQNEALFRAYSALEGSSADMLSADQRKAIEHALRDFRLAGVDLPEEKKSRYKAIRQKLATLGARFEENVLDATNAWSYHARDANELSGLPEQVRARAEDKAREQEQDGWVLTLDYPTYHAVVTHADDPGLRRIFYEAWTTRASDQGPMASCWDNSEIISEILRLRDEAAELLGFASYADYSLATKMARTAKDVTQFLEQLAEHSLPVARQELTELEAFAGHSIDAWDVAYFAERLRQSRFQLSEDELKPYFPVSRVLPGMLEVARRLFDIDFVERHDVDTWHADVRFFEVRNKNGRLRGSFYLDLYARPRKRGGAWMDECIGRMNLRNTDAMTPVAHLVCNFMPPVGDEPSLLTHADVLTLFHEFGHTLHHLMTLVDIPSIAGINGVPWDAVELPSQFMENFAWQPEVLPLISAHYRTGESLPSEKLELLQASKKFQAGLHTVRQLEFALFDFRLHSERVGRDITSILNLLDDVRQRISVVPVPDFNRFPHSFSHIFAGGYGAGYYSYKWAEVLAADVFAAFEENGVFDAQTASAFCSAILERGGATDAMDAFMQFRGRKPQIEHLLRQSGMIQ